MFVDMFKKVIQWKLSLLAKIYINVKNIEVIAITGSAGKTTTKITIGQILPTTMIYVPKEAYNTEYGLPLALFDEKVPVNPKNLWAWSGVICRMFLKIFRAAPYRRIVLEYGADKPGDISYLTGIAHPHISIVTTVLPVHIEGFGSVEEIATEKARLIECQTTEDFAILNFDDSRVREMSTLTAARVISFGARGKDVDIEYSSLKYNEVGMAFDIKWKGDSYAVNIPVVAPHLLPSYLAAFAVGLVLGEDSKKLAKKLSHITAEKGRMNLLKGLNGSMIIDDSYNSNPESAKAALTVLSKYKGRKIAVLGSMNELGDYAKAGHEKVGIFASGVADELVVIGEVAGEYLYPAAAKKINKSNIHKFKTSDEAGQYLKNIVAKGDVLLFKGSQNGVFTEEAVKYVLKDPNSAPELLVRQTAMWQNKKGKL